MTNRRSSTVPCHLSEACDLVVVAERVAFELARVNFAISQRGAANSVTASFRDEIFEVLRRCDVSAMVVSMAIRRKVRVELVVGLHVRDESSPESRGLWIADVGKEVRITDDNHAMASPR